MKTTLYTLAALALLCASCTKEKLTMPKAYSAAEEKPKPYTPPPVRDPHNDLGQVQ